MEGEREERERENKMIFLVVCVFSLKSERVKIICGTCLGTGRHC